MAITKAAPAVEQMVLTFDGSGNLADIVAQLRLGILENGQPTSITYTGRVSLFALLTPTQQTNLGQIATRLRQLALANVDLALPTPVAPGPFTV